MEQMQAIDGRVTAVRGAVLDVAFEGATLPPIDDALLITPDKSTPTSPRCSRIWTRRQSARSLCNREGSGATIGIVSESDQIRPDRVAREARRQSSSSTASARYR